jgi:hypothetical protein
VGDNDARAVQAVNYTNKWLEWTNETFVQELRRERQQEHDAKVKRRRDELNKAQKNAEASRRINDLLAGL